MHLTNYTMLPIKSSCLTEESSEELDLVTGQVEKKKCSASLNQHSASKQPFLTYKYGEFITFNLMSYGGECAESAINT